MDDGILIITREHLEARASYFCLTESVIEGVAIEEIKAYTDSKRTDSNN